MVSRHPHRSGTARLLAVCALLFGLFAMHGLPVSAVDGCHAQATAAPTPATAGGMAPTPAGHEAATRTDAPPGAVQVHPGAEARAGGSLCVATLGRGRLALTAMVLLAVVPLWSMTGSAVQGCLAAVLGRRRRGPPISGRSLLLHVCVART